MWDMFPKWAVVLLIWACAIEAMIVVVATGLPKSIGVPVIIGAIVVVVGGAATAVSISYTDRPRKLIPPPLQDTSADS
jgi:hypothetical protein